MKFGSLRLRLFTAAAVSVAIALVAAGLVLTHLFEQHVIRDCDAELTTYLHQLDGAATVNSAGEIMLGRPLQDSRFEDARSGYYWQIVDSGTGKTLRSRSLGSGYLRLAGDAGAGVAETYMSKGPRGTPVRVQERLVTFHRPAGNQAVRLAVALEASEIESERRAFAGDLWPSLAVIGSLLLAATWLYIGIGLRPLDDIHRSLNAVRTGASQRLDGSFPSEVMPLVEEVNALLVAQQESLARARARAADLAHGLKTPLAVLQSDAERLRARGQTDIADEMAELAHQMRRHVQRELARTRTRGALSARATLLKPVAERLTTSLRRTPAGERLRWHLAVDEGLAVAADPHDLTELLGNLLDNACKWARSAVCIEARDEGDMILIHIFDDGAGVPELALASLIERGVRLDQTMPGTGLGLAIAHDIAAACDGSLQLSNRPDGGFSVAVRLPVQPKSHRHV